ncbi:phytochrome-like protein cph2 [Clostridium puniceum]|uniref:Phytochrome-like protein cph2 n=1 Tax=Clostridium puniceum TaxID=29367 RepID=A0A1S8TPU0_9CLOT|nr:GGDEF domain-containing protein [Clostridium puniceum]OOM79654.1 phytochrome-like protein cph2 [Clostridium puniceum]
MNKDDIRKKIDLLLKESNELRYKDSKRAIEISNHAFNLCQDIDYILGEKVANLYKAHCYYNIGENDKVLPLVLDSLQYSVKEGFCDLEWMAYNLLGIVFFHLGDIERSMDFYDKAQVVAKEIDLGKIYHIDVTSQKSMVLTLNNIAENYKLLKQYREALNYCETVYNIDTQFDYSLTRGLILLSLGEIYYLLGDYENANCLSYKALQYLNKYNYNIAKADTYKLMALISWKKGIYKNADKYFHISMKLNDIESVPNYKVDALISYSEYLKEQERTTEALKVLTNACDLSIQYNLPEKVSKISLMLSIFYGQLGEYKNAFEYTKLHHEYEEEYNKLYYKNIVNSLNIKRKMQEIEKENNAIIEKNKTLQIQREALQILVEKISIISKLGQKITATLDKDALMENLYSSIKSFMNLSYFAIALYDEENSMINYIYVMDREKKIKQESLSINGDQTFAEKCIKNRELIVINNTHKEFTQYIDQKTYDYLIKLDNNAELNSLIFCPLIVNTKVIGIITIQSEEKDAFTPYHIEMVKSLSSYAAIAINNTLKSMELERLNEVLVSLAEKDKLTGIANRRRFDNYIDYIWYYSIQKGNSIALMIIDIDYFKEYNDNFGHLEGDKCITTIANALDNLNNKQYFVARYGGDEFMVVLPKYSIGDAVKLGEEIETKMEELNISHKFSKVSDRVTLSIGVASVIPDENITIKELITKADNALYIAKKQGRNQVAYI